MSSASKKDELNDREQIFVYEYIIDFNGTRAAKSAGYSHATATQIAHNLLNKPRVKNAVKKATDERKDRLGIDADKVLSMYWSIATADYNEIVQLRRNNCRYCFGVSNEYQWTVAEYENACEKAINNQEPEPLCAGGVGFNSTGEPNSKCPECQGEGVANMHIADTRNLSAQANLVYQGLKANNNGLEVLTIDRLKALDAVAKHLGMFKETINHVSDDNSMTPKAGIDLTGLSDDELRTLATIVAKTEPNTG